MGESLKDIIYQKTREDIVNGRLLPGERLTEVRLAQEFKTSRSPIREALRMLESDGLITFENNKGISVAKLSIKQINEIFTLRVLLEGCAARITAEVMNKKDLALLRDYQELQKMAAKNVDMPAWFKTNTLFHNALFLNCGNVLLIQFIENLKRRVARYNFVTITVPWQFQIYLDHHEKMLQGCKKNDGEMVEKYMKLHINTIKDALVKEIQERGLVYE
jgi:DNA-binding GntR family transcriptional regulator